MVRLYFSFILLVTVVVTASAQTAPSAEEVLQKSIAYHGMEGWGTQHHRLTLKEIRPNGADRTTVIDIDNVQGRFAVRSEREGNLVEASVGGGACTATVNGSAEIPDDLVERYRLSCDGLRWWRDYYGYLYGLPVKLQDPGTRLAADVETTTFQGQEVLTLKVTYDADMGQDTWYFYVDPSTYALTGCRFYHDESKNDGEYIVFEGEVVHDGLRLPKTRRWYMNADDAYLGADVIEAFERPAPDGP